MPDWITTQTVRVMAIKAIVFAATFCGVVWIVCALPATSFFWTVLNQRFAQDERYQLQTLFLPDQNRDIPVLMVGDSQFLSRLPESLRAQPGAETVIINGYDPDDLGMIGQGIDVGTNHTDTRVCGLIVQISPVFSLRAKAFGKAPVTVDLNAAFQDGSTAERISTFFDLLDEWAQTKRSMPTLESPPKRPQRMVGQTRFADPTEENWDRAFEFLPGFQGPVIGILDTDGTDWGADSDLIRVTEERLEALAAQNDQFTWLPMDQLAMLQPSECEGQ